jgi:hypothetical protein
MTQLSATKATRLIDDENRQFTTQVKERLCDLSGFSDDALEWLMTEHFQFSVSNPSFLAMAAETTATLDDPGVAAELGRNRDEEDGHAAIYRKGLAQIGTDVGKRVEFAPTTEFLEKIRTLASSGPLCALGAMYATETAAIFEHEVFWDISREVCGRRGIEWTKTTLKRFHDMHLDGVEQSHKDGLAGFVDEASTLRVRALDPTSVDGAAEVRRGAAAAIDAMRTWWRALLDSVTVAPVSAAPATTG